MDAQNNLLVKFADDITASAPAKSGLDSATNQMTLNLSKTWEMVLQSGSMKPLPTPIAGIEQKNWQNCLRIRFK